MLNISGRSPLLTGWLCCLQCNPICSLPSWLPEHTAHGEPAVTSIPRSLSAGPFSRHSPPSLYLCPALLCPTYISWHFPLFSVISSVSSANLLRMYSTPASTSASRSLIKTVNPFHHPAQKKKIKQINQGFDYSCLQ